jgi:hypothetical protein
MPTQQKVQMTGKCTTCGKTFVITESGLKEAREIGVPFSPCCQAVSTVERVSVRLPRP